MVMIAKPIIPQTKIGFVGTTAARILPSAGETVAIPLVHDWGPLGTELDRPEVLASYAEWIDRYGDSDTEGRTAVAGAFNGHGLPGSGGAGGVIPLRMGTGAVRATVTLDNTAAADAITITARWSGLRGNRYSVKVDADPADATRDRLRVLFDGAVVETYSYVKADITSLVAAINARAQGNITALQVATGTALALTAGTSLAGGTNGAAPDGAAHIAAQDALEFQPFALLAPANLTDLAIRASWKSWVQAQEVANRPVRMVVGGLPAETLDTALTRTDAMADPHIVNFGVGTYRDDLLDKDLSTAQLAPRIAGVLAARGESSALTGAELGGLHIIGGTGISAVEAELAVQRGLTVAIRTDSPDADIRIAKGLTTFTADTDPVRPRKIFEEPRFIGIMDNFVRRMKQWGDRKIIGSVPVNEDTRDAVRQEGTRLIEDLKRRGLIITKAEGAEEDPFFRTPVTVDDTLPFEFGWQFAYTANYLLGEGRVR